jgi:hypothetical protein
VPVRETIVLGRLSLIMASQRRDAQLLPELKGDNQVSRRCLCLCAGFLLAVVSISGAVLGSEPEHKRAGAQVAVDAPGVSIAPIALWSSPAAVFNSSSHPHYRHPSHRDHCGAPCPSLNRRVLFIVAPHVHPPTRSLDEAASVLVRLLRQQPALEHLHRPRPHCTAPHRAANLRAPRPATAP